MGLSHYHSSHINYIVFYLAKELKDGIIIAFLVYCSFLILLLPNNFLRTQTKSIRQMRKLRPGDLKGLLRVVQSPDQRGWH